LPADAWVQTQLPRPMLAFDAFSVLFAEGDSIGFQELNPCPDAFFIYSSKQPNPTLRPFRFLVHQTGRPSGYRYQDWPDADTQSAPSSHSCKSSARTLPLMAMTAKGVLMPASHRASANPIQASPLPDPGSQQTDIFGDH